MDTILKTKTQKYLDGEIERLINQLGVMSPCDPDYDSISKNLKTLCEAREKKDPGSISVETILSIGASLVSILVILNFEKTGTITSKALSFLWKK